METIKAKENFEKEMREKANELIGYGIDFEVCKIMIDQIISCIRAEAELTDLNMEKAWDAIKRLKEATVAIDEMIEAPHE